MLSWFNVTLGILTFTADLPTRCRRSQSIEKRSDGLPNCLPGVEEGSQLRREVPACLPGVEEASQLRREVPACRPVYQV